MINSMLSWAVPSLGIQTSSSHPPPLSPPSSPFSVLNARTTKFPCRALLDVVDPQALWNEKLNLFLASPQQKNFVYAGFLEEYNSLVCYFEYPLNDNPTDLEIELAERYMFKADARYIILIMNIDNSFKATIVSSSVSSEGEFNPYLDSCSELTIYRCCYFYRRNKNPLYSDCVKFIPKKYAIPLCKEFGHVCCIDHLFHLNHLKNDLKWDRDLENLKRKVEKNVIKGHNNTNDDVILRTSICNTYLENDSSDEKKYVTFATEDCIECVGCRWLNLKPCHNMYFEPMFRSLRAFQATVASKDVDFQPGGDDNGGFHSPSLGISSLATCSASGGSSSAAAVVRSVKYNHPFYASDFFVNTCGSEHSKYQQEFAQVTVSCPKSGILSTHRNSSQIIVKGDDVVEIRRKIKSVSESDEILYSEDFIIYCRDVSKREVTWKILITDERYYAVMGFYDNHKEPMDSPKVFDFGSSEEKQWESLQDISGLYATIHHITSGFELCIQQHHHANLEPIISVAGQATKDRYNAAISSIILDLEPSYWGYRKIRGDGNCYYRSVIFGLLEDIINKRDCIRLNTIRNLLDRAKSIQELEYLLTPDTSIFAIEEYEFPAFYSIFTKELDWLTSKLDHTWDLFAGVLLNIKVDDRNDSIGWNTAREFENEVVANDRLDQILVLVCRILTAEWAIQNQNRDFHGLPFMVAVDATDILDYCRSNVLRWSESAEGPTVQLGALSESLHCDIRIVTKHYGAGGVGGGGGGGGSVKLEQQQPSQEVVAAEVEGGVEAIESAAQATPSRDGNSGVSCGGGSSDLSSSSQNQSQSQSQTIESFNVDNVYSAVEGPGQGKTGSVIICFRPGHYDLLYAKETTTGGVRSSSGSGNSMGEKATGSESSSSGGGDAMGEASAATTTTTASCLATAADTTITSPEAADMSIGSGGRGIDNASIASTKQAAASSTTMFSEYQGTIDHILSEYSENSAPNISLKNVAKAVRDILCSGNTLSLTAVTDSLHRKKQRL